MEDKPYMVKQTISFSDGTETVINYTQNGEALPIEQASAEMVAENNVPEIVEMPKEDEADHPKDELVDEALDYL